MNQTCMQRVIFLQLAATVITAIIAGVLGGGAALISALLGGLCSVVPNGLFAWRLSISARKPGGASPLVFIIGEFIKIGMTIALLGAVVWLYRDVNWLAMIAAFIVVLKSYIILLFRR